MKKKCRICLSVKLIALLLFAFIVQVNGEVLAQKVRISLERKNASIESVLREIEEKSDYSFLYNNKLIDVARTVDVSVQDKDLSEVLDMIFEGKVDYQTIDRQIVLTPRNIQRIEKTVSAREENKSGAASLTSGQEKLTIRGIVVDENGVGMPGVSVVVKGTITGVATDVDGNFTINAPAGAILSFSYIGYKNQEFKVEKEDALRIEMQPDAEKLDEVVVVGYGTTKVKDLTGAVSSVTANELEKTNATNVASILQGKAAGVMISTGAAKPGEPVKMRVRGSTSLEGTNEPLYVVDGVPVEQDDMISLNPSDIQSMDILKDASAAAIYGSRAANGVVLITTKRGRVTDKPQLNIHHYTSIEKEIENFRILSADEFRNVVRNAARNTLLVDPANTSAQDILDGKELMEHNTNWYDQLSQLAITNNTELSVRGGSNKVRYFVSLGLTTQDGVLKGDDLSRYSGRMNFDWDVTKALKFGTNINVSYTQQNKAGQGLWQIRQFRPDVPVYDENGEYYKIGSTTDNPVAKTKITDKYDDYRLTGTIFGELELIEDLKFKSSLSASKYMGYNTNYIPSFLYSGSNNGQFKGQGKELSGQSHRTLWDNTLSYNHTFNNIHAVDAVVGISFENSEQRSFSATGRNYPMDEYMNNLSSASTPYDVSGSSAGRGLLSTFGRFNYKLLDKYMFTFTGRYDGSSRFGKNNEFGFFPSGAFAWKINKEPFLEDVKQIDELKLRVSAGLTGTQNIGDYNNKDLYGPNDYMGKPGVTPTVLGNKDLKWETTRQYDAAIDFAFYNYRFSGTLAWYYKDTDDLLWWISFPSSLQPFSGMYKNVGRVVNRGLEFTLSADIFRETAVKWDVTLNISGNRNKVKYLIDQGATEWGGQGNMHGTGSEVLAEGYPVGSILGYRVKGIFQSQEEINTYNEEARRISGDASKYYWTKETKPGNAIYEDVNGDGFVNYKDKVIVGNPEPDFFGGLSTNVSWKGLSLYAMFNFSVGNERTYGNALQNIPTQLSNFIDYNLDNRWSPENPTAKLPSMYIGEGVAETSNLVVYDASYLKLSNLRLQYELPVILKSKFYKSGQVYFSMSNVFTITKYPGVDPATVGSTSANYGGAYDNDIYPGVRTYTVGLKLNF